MHGVFKEFCKHEICDCNNEAYGHNLKLVLPISTFIPHAEMIWENTHHFSGCVSSKWKHHGQLKRINIPSEDINIVLLGQLKISSYTGRMQLLDRTGSIDVMIPHLPSTWNASYIYEVVDYGLAIEGIPKVVDHLRFLDKWISCRSIFHCAPLAKEMRTLLMFIHFHLNGETLRNALFYPCLGLKDEFKELENQTFHLFQVTHKYPVLQKFQGNSVVSKNSSMFIEVIVLPWDLILYGMVTSTHPEKSRMDQSNNVMKHHSNKSYPEHSPCKKRRTVETSCRVFNSGLINNRMESDNDLSKSYCSRGELFTKHRCGKSSRSHDIPCLASIRSLCNQNLVTSANFHAKLKKVDSDGNLIGDKVLLELQPENFSKYHCLEIGGNYIMKHHPEDSFCVIKHPDQVKSVKSLCTSTARIWSIHFSFADDLTMSESKHDRAVRDSSREAMVGEQAELLFQGPPRSSTKMISDVSLHLSSSSTGFLGANLKELEEDHIKPAVKLKESYNLSSSSCTATTMHGTTFGSPNSNSLFCEGNLISLQGDVFNIHGLDHCSANLHSNCTDSSDVYKLRFVQGLQGSFCIHVMVDHQTVKIFGPLSRHTYLTGFGPGINATFHRILQLGGNKLMLTPVSFIVINSIGVVGDAYSEKCDEWRAADVYNAPWPASDVFSAIATSGDTVSSGLISDLTLQGIHPKSMRFLCRIVAINVLILEIKGKTDDLPSKTMSKAQSFDILLVAGFTVDDGSGTSCCWADGEKVATLLRLYEELPEGAFENSDWTLKWAGTGSNSWGTIMSHFGRLLKKHNRIMVKNYGSMIDSSYQDLTVSVSSENTLSTSDENLLKFVILNASCDNIWTVVASKMDLKAVGLLDKKHRLEIDTTTDSMSNLWATEIYHTNPLNEARNMMQELVVHDGMKK